VKIFTLSQNALSTDGAVSVPSNERLRCSHEKNRSPTISEPGASAMTIATATKNTIVLAVETNTARRPNIFDPRAAGAGASITSRPLLGPLPPIAIVLFEPARPLRGADV
jgi:hypothetical protein